MALGKHLRTHNQIDRPLVNRSQGLSQALTLTAVAIESGNPGLWKDRLQFLFKLLSATALGA